ncbi:MAG: NAD-dependent epimerase/dehydratase family protein [Thermoplasmata archaeon]
MSAPSARPRMLLVGGGGGLAGRAVLEEFAPDWTIRSVHRQLAPGESAAGVEWVPGDVATVRDWSPLLAHADLVVNLAWYRQGPERRFRALREGLIRLLQASEGAGVRRWVQVSVPDSPASMETTLPYMVHKRAVDNALSTSSLSYSIVRPTMLFGPRDKLLTVMLRTIARYHRFPMFGDGEYHVSPIAARDLARVLRREAGLTVRHTVDAGGPTRWKYRDLTDVLFAALGRAPRYVRCSPRGALRLSRFLEAIGSSLLYAYEVEWLLSDRLGLPPYEGLDRPLDPVEPFVRAEAAHFSRPPSSA